MSVLNFNGSSHYLDGSGSGALNAAMTVATLIRHDTLANTGCLMSTNSSVPAMGWEFKIESNDRPAIYNDNAGSTSDPGTGYEIDDTDEFWIVVFTYSPGEAPRLHIQNSTGAGAWLHADGDDTQVAPDSAAGGTVYIGAFNVPGSGLFDYFEGDIALHGLWNGIEMTDGQVEDLGTGKHVDDWLEHAAGAPTSLTPMTSATPTDLQGLITWTNHGAALTGADPAGWTLTPGGGGGGTDDILVRVAGAWVASDLKVRASGTWV